MVVDAFGSSPAAANLEQIYDRYRFRRLKRGIYSIVDAMYRIISLTCNALIGGRLSTAPSHRLSPSSKTCNVKPTLYLTLFLKFGSKARDFRGALEQAESTGRPVRFLRWGYELPRLGLDELSRRNVYRFATTGR